MAATSRVCFDLGKNRPKFWFGVVWQTHLSQTVATGRRTYFSKCGGVAGTTQAYLVTNSSSLDSDMPHSNGQGHIGQEIKTKNTHAQFIIYLCIRVKCDQKNRPEEEFNHDLVPQTVACMFLCWYLCLPVCKSEYV